MALYIWGGLQCQVCDFCISLYKQLFDRQAKHQGD